MNDDRNIVLLGFRGTGKSTVAGVLARSLGRPLISIDREIERREGKTIAEIVGESGWNRFRQLEREEARRAGQSSRSVIDTGGGIVVSPENIEDLRKNGVVFLLKSEIGTIRDRLRGADDRPSLTGADVLLEIEEVLADREPLYLRACDYVVDTEGKKPAEIAALIVDLIRGHEKSS